MLIVLHIVFCSLLLMSVDHQSVQEPVSPRLAKGYSPEGCWSLLFFVVFPSFFPFISACFSGVCFIIILAFSRHSF